MNLRQAFLIAAQEFRLRDQGTFLGFFWTLFNPFLLFVALYGVFRNYESTSNASFAYYLLAGILFWNFFTGCSYVGLSALFGRPQYVHGTTVRLGTLILSGIITQFTITLLEAFICFLTLKFIFHGSFFESYFYFLCGIFCVAPFSLGISMLILWVRRFFLDAGRLWELSLRIGFFLTPIFYYIDDKPERALLKLNPIYLPLTISREGFSSVEIHGYFYIGLLFCFAWAMIVFTEKNRSKLVEVG